MAGTPLSTVAAKNGWEMLYDQPTNRVTLKDPLTGKNLSFTSGQGSQYGIGGLENGRNVVSDLSKLTNYFTQPVGNPTPVSGGYKTQPVGNSGPVPTLPNYTGGNPKIEKLPGDPNAKPQLQYLGGANTNTGPQQDANGQGLYYAAGVTPTNPVQTPPNGMVPVRQVLENAGRQVGWDPRLGVVSVDNKPIDSSKFTLVNGRYYANPGDLVQYTNPALAPTGPVQGPATWDQFQKTGSAYLKDSVPQKSTFDMGTLQNKDTGGQGTEKKTDPWTPTEIKLDQGQDTGQDPQITELVGKINGELNAPTPTFNVISYDDALKQAMAELKPKYDEGAVKLTNSTNGDLEFRGIFNSPMASQIMAERQAKLENERQAAYAERAAQIVAESRAQATGDKNFYLQNRTSRLDSLGTLLNTLSNRETTKGQLTGILNGIKTLAKQELEANTTKMNNDANIDAGKLSLDNKKFMSDRELAIAKLMGSLDNKDTLDKILADRDYNLKEGLAIGIVNGQDTLENKKLKLEALNAKVENAMKRAQTFGKITDETDAMILGVPVGTPTAEADIAAKKLAADIKIANDRIASEEKMNTENNQSRERMNTVDNQTRERMNSADIASRERISANEIASRASLAASDNDMKNFSKDVEVWKMTGKAPDSAALRKYGIAPGTAYTGTAEEQIQAIKAEGLKADEAKRKDLQGRIDSAKKDYGITDDNTAEATAMILTNPDRNSAIKKLNENVEQLQKEGVDISLIKKAIDSKYGAPPPQDPWWYNITMPYG